MYLVLALFFSNNTNVGGTLGTPKGTIYINYKDIYEKWTTLYPHMQIGYTFFRKNRPSWIVKGKIEKCVQNCHSLLTFLGSCSACKRGTGSFYFKKLFLPSYQTFGNCKKGNMFRCRYFSFNRNFLQRDKRRCHA